MKKGYRRVLIPMGIICIFLILLCIIRNISKVTSVGVIGGADGPTSIMISKTTDGSAFLYILTGVIGVVFITLLVIAFKKK